MVKEGGSDCMEYGRYLEGKVEWYDPGANHEICLIGHMYVFGFKGWFK